MSNTQASAGRAGCGAAYRKPPPTPRRDESAAAVAKQRFAPALKAALARKTKEDKERRPRLLCLTQTRERTHLGKSSTYLAIADGTHPAPVKISARRVGFFEWAIDAYLETIEEMSRGQQSGGAQ